MRGRRAARGVGRTAPVALTAAVDPSRHLSEGALVQASIRARLLGIPLLRLDATVVLMPAETAAPFSTPHKPARTRSAGVSLTHSAAAGHGLAEAVRSINEGAEVLAQVRRNGAR